MKECETNAEYDQDHRHDHRQDHNQHLIFCKSIKSCLIFL